MAILNNYAYKGALRFSERLNGMSLARKLRYGLKVVVGETPAERVFHTFGLRLVEISLTDRCQCRCGHCFAATRAPKDELTAKEVNTLLEDLAQLVLNSEIT